MKSYSEYLQEKRYSSNSIIAHLHYAQKFNRFISQQSLDSESVKVKDIYIYLEQIKDKKTKSSYNSELSSMKIFFNYLSIENTNPELQRINYFKSLKFNKLPVCTSKKDTNKIDLLIKNSTKFDYYEKIILILIMNHGMIPKDIIELKMSDVDLKNSTVRFVKNHKELQLSLYKYDRTCFFNYYEEKYQSMNEFLLLDKKNKVIKKHHIAKVFEKLKRYDIRTNPTKLRNRFVLDCLNAGIPEIYIANYMGIDNIKQIIRFNTLTDNFLQNGQLEINKLRVRVGDNENGKITKCRGSITPLRIVQEGRKDTSAGSIIKQIYN